MCRRASQPTELCDAGAEGGDDLIVRLRVCNVVINLVCKRVGLGKNDTEQTDEQRDWPRESRKRSREMTWSTSASSLSHPSTRSAMQNTSLADELMNDMDDFDSDEEEPVAGPSGDRKSVV